MLAKMAICPGQARIFSERTWIGKWPTTVNPYRAIASSSPANSSNGGNQDNDIALHLDQRPRTRA